MTLEELFKLAIDQLPKKIEKIHPLHKAMLEECCEAALSNKQGVNDGNTLLMSVYLAFHTSDIALKSTLNASLKATNADQITLNYRNQTFIIPRDSSFLK